MVDPGLEGLQALMTNDFEQYCDVTRTGEVACRHSTLSSESFLLSSASYRSQTGKFYFAISLSNSGNYVDPEGGFVLGFHFRVRPRHLLLPSAEFCRPNNCTLENNEANLADLQGR